MSNTNVKNGSFRVQVPTVSKLVDNTKIDADGAYSLFQAEYECVDIVQYTVPMLSQNEYANGWTQVVPRKRFYMKHYKDENGVTRTRLGSNVYKMNVTLAGLPYHLWHRIHTTKYGVNTVQDGLYHYYVNSTNVDSEIRELVKLTNDVYQLKYSDRVIDLLHTLKDNDVYGWVVIKATSMYL